MSDSFAAAFGTARGGFVRDALVAGYPRLAGLLEGAAARVLRDSSARDVVPALDEEQVGSLQGLGGLQCGHVGVFALMFLGDGSTGRCLWGWRVEDRE